jgi:type VI secretion system protein VasD
MRRALSMPESLPVFSPMRPLISVLVTLVCTLWLAACASSDPNPPHEPVKMTLTLKAASDVNPDDHKHAAPIIVRVYELKDANAFNEADFFSLQDKDKTVLADDLVTRDQFQMRPGDTASVKRDSKQETRALGVIAAYRDLPNSIWRAVWPVPDTSKLAWYHILSTKLKLTIQMNASAIKIVDEQAEQQKK